MPKKDLNEDEYRTRKAFVLAIEALGTSKNSGWAIRIDEKKQLLRSIGIHGLLIRKDEDGDNKFLQLDDCNDRRIHDALFHTYDQYRTQVQRYENEETGRKDQAMYETLVGLIDAERQIQDPGALERALERTAIVMDNASDLVLERISREFGPETVGDYAPCN